MEDIAYWLKNEIGKIPAFLEKVNACLIKIKVNNVIFHKKLLFLNHKMKTDETRNIILISFRKKIFFP